MDEEKTGVVAFDTEESDEVRGVPYVVRIPEDGIELSVLLRVAGAVEYRVTDPGQFAFCGDPEGLMRRSVLSGVLAAAADRPAGPDGMPSGLEEAILQEDVVLRSFRNYTGTEPVSVTLSACEPGPEDRKRLDKLRHMAALRNPLRAEELMRKTMEEAQAAIEKAEAAAAAAPAKEPPPEREEPERPILRTASWICTCGSKNTGNFCPDCGAAREWTCACGTRNAGNFCTQCGRRRG